MAKRLLTDLATTPTWSIENRDATLTVEKKTGFIRGLLFRKAKLDLFQQNTGGIPGFIGHLTIYDEQDEVWYDDLRSPFRVTSASKRGNTIRMTRRYKGAPFEVKLTLAMDKHGLRWCVDARKTVKKAADRSLRVHFCLPLIAGWDVWAPCNFGEKTFDGMTPFEFMYTQVPYVSEQEVILPMVSHYHRLHDVGYSVHEPIDANVPAAKFAYSNAGRCFNFGSMRKDVRTVPMLETINYYIGLVGDRPMHTEIFLTFHEGCWRPGVGKVYRKYREFFDPFNDAIYDREGVFECGGIQNADHIQAMRAMGIKTLEVHGHFQDYCDYFQDGKEEWYRIGTKERLRRKLLAEAGMDGNVRSAPGTMKTDRSAEMVEDYLATHSDEEIAEKAGVPLDQVRHRRDDVKTRLQKLADAGISPHWYFNYTDGYRPRVEKDWPDSISRDEDGTPIRSGPSGSSATNRRRRSLTSIPCWRGSFWTASDTTKSISRTMTA